MTHPGYRDFFFDDIDQYNNSSNVEIVVTKEKILEFAHQWDPMIFHTDEELAKTTPHGGLIAPGTLLLAIRIRLLHSGGVNRKVLASVGFEDVKFVKPVYANDRLKMNIKLIGKRLSRSRPKFGLATFYNELLNQDDEPVLTMVDTIMVERDPSKLDK